MSSHNNIGKANNRHTGIDSGRATIVVQGGNEVTQMIQETTAVLTQSLFRGDDHHRMQKITPEMAKRREAAEGVLCPANCPSGER